MPLVYEDAWVDVPMVAPGLSGNRGQDVSHNMSLLRGWPVQGVVGVLTVVVTLQSACMGGDPPTTPSPDVSALFTVTGTVFQTTANGRSLVDGPSIWLFNNRRGHEYHSEVTRGDASGTFELQRVPSASLLLVRASAAGLMQPCAASVTVTGNVETSVELVAAGARPANVVSPTLSGRVVQRANGRAAPRRYITYADNCGLESATGWTDDQGSYVFCNLPHGSGCLYVALAEGDRTWETDVQRVPVAIEGDTVLDVEIER